MSEQAKHPFLSPVFGSHMVLQRDRPNRFWGWTTPGERVKVSVGGRWARGVAGPDGKWVVRISPLPVGGPYEVVVEGSSRVVLEDVLVGDVWLCSGQSNMEMGLAVTANGPEVVASVADSDLRLFTVGRHVAYRPQETLAGEWKVSSPSAVGEGGWGGFTAVGYYFGRELRERLGVPIGLIQAAWGGTSGEAWVSEAALRRLTDFDDDLNELAHREASGQVPVGTYLELWSKTHDQGVIEGWQTSAEDWETTTVPDGFSGLGLAGQPGSAWFRRDVEFPDPLPSWPVTLHLGELANSDWVWLNGQPIGYGGGSYVRGYEFPVGLIQPGRNSLVVRVFCGAAPGGFVGSSADVYVSLGDGSRIELAGEWQGKVGKAILPETPRPRDLNVNPSMPNVLYNGMVAPMGPLAIRGAIWYQGETNTGRAHQYRRLLPALIADWRRTFGRRDMPFYIVSLAAFWTRAMTPGDDNWAELREAQAFTAARDRHSGLAVTIDVGDADDVHPTDKRTVGHRLALVALANEYGYELPYSGPVYREMTVEGGAVRLSFADTDGGLVAQGGRLEGFAVAGADRKWHWAEAAIDGDTVVVSSADVPRPVAVRYAWDINPLATLFNGAGLPAVPFRTDTWRGLSYGKR